MAAQEPLLSLDALATGAEGMIANEKCIDWSSKPHSQRADRPLSDEDTLRLSQKSNLKGFQYALGNMTLLIVNATVIAQLLNGPPQLYPALAALILWQGFSIEALGFAGQHECCHFTAFASIRLNKVFMYVNSLPAIRFGEHERLLHRDHHTFTGISGKDTELVEWGEMVYKNGFRKVPETVSEYWWLFWLLTWQTVRSKARKLFHCARGHPVDYTCTEWTVARDVNSGSPSIKDTLQWWARAHIAFYVVFVPAFIKLVGLWLMFWCWLLPCYFGPALTWILQIAEHADCTRDGNGLTNTRSLEVNPLVRFVYWNMNYHAEHHLYPTFPFHQLHEAHELLKGHISKQCDGVFQLHRRVITDYIPKQIADEPVTGERT